MAKPNSNTSAPAQTQDQDNRPANSAAGSHPVETRCRYLRTVHQNLMQSLMASELQFCKNVMEMSDSDKERFDVVTFQTEFDKFKKAGQVLTDLYRSKSAELDGRPISPRKA